MGNFSMEDIARDMVRMARSLVARSFRADKAKIEEVMPFRKFVDIVMEAKWAINYLAIEYGLKRMKTKDVIDSLESRVPREIQDAVALAAMEEHNSEMSPRVQVMVDVNKALEFGQ
jgi:hypothetical protein